MAPDMNAILAAWRDGTPGTTIARDHGIPTATLYRWLRKAGAGPRGTTPPKLDPTTTAGRYLAGDTLHAIAADTGASISTVAETLGRSGVIRRKKWQRGTTVDRTLVAPLGRIATAITWLRHHHNGPDHATAPDGTAACRPTGRPPTINRAGGLDPCRTCVAAIVGDHAATRVVGLIRGLL